MKNVNLKNLKVYLSLDKKDYKTDGNGNEIIDEQGNKILNYSCITNAHKQIADLIYNSMSGINHLSLALKLYNSDGEIEMDEEEMNLFVCVVNTKLSPNAIDAISERLK